MRALTHNQNTKLPQIVIPQIDMAQIARDSSDAILSFSNNAHSHFGNLIHQKLLHNMIISMTSITAIIAISFVTF